MSQWRRVAIERFPHLQRVIADASNVMDMWHALGSAVSDQFGRKRTLDEKFVADVFDYARWCLNHRSRDVNTAVIVCFYEHLPDHPHLSKQLGRWLTAEDFERLPGAWEYVFTKKKDLEAFRKEFYRQRQYWSRLRGKRPTAGQQEPPDEEHESRENGDVRHDQC